MHKKLSITVVIRSVCGHLVVILISSLSMLSLRRHRSLISRFLVQKALQRHHVTTGTLFYYRCDQFFTHTQVASSKNPKHFDSNESVGKTRRFFIDFNLSLKEPQHQDISLSYYISVKSYE